MQVTVSSILRNSIQLLSQSRSFRLLQSSSQNQLLRNQLLWNQLLWNQLHRSLPKCDIMSVFERGLFTLRIPMELHALNRKRLVDKLREVQSLNGKTAIVLLQGGSSKTRYCSDHEPLFRQESYFHWMFGVQEPDFLGAVNLVSGKSCLFAPRLPESYAVWMGRLATLNDIRMKYEVDECFYVDQVSSCDRFP